MSNGDARKGKGRQAVVVSDDQQIAGRIRAVLRHRLWECGADDTINATSAVARLRYLHPDMVFVVLNSDNGSVKSLRGVRDSTSASLVAVGPSDNSEFILGCLHDGGADQYVSLDQLEREIEDVVQRADPSASGKIIAVVSPGGGAGASTLAVNLAVFLAHDDQTCGLFDLNLSFGDLASLLDLEPTRSVADLCRNVSRMDRAMFEQLLVPHETGIHLLAAPLSFEDVHEVTPEGVTTALKFARDLFPYVVVDMDHNCRDEQAAAYGLADTVFMVARADFTSLHNVRRQMVFFKKLGLDPAKTLLIANGYGRPKQLSVGQIEEVLKVKVHEFLPDDPRHVNLANNTGAPIATEFPSAKYSRKIRRLAESLEEQVTSAASA